MFWFGFHATSTNKVGHFQGKFAFNINYGPNKRSEETSYANIVYENGNGLGSDLSSTFCELILSFWWAFWDC